jgi:hypothetical protein
LRVLACDLDLLALLGTFGFCVTFQLDFTGLDDQVLSISAARISRSASMRC